MVSLTSSPTIARRKLGSNAEGRAADGGGGRKARVRLVIHALNRASGAFHIQHHRLGDAVEGQVAVDCEAVAALGHAGTGKGRGWELGEVEEIRSLEVIVACVFAGVHGGDVDGCRDRRLGHVCLIVHEGGSHLAEAAMDVGDGQVGDA